ncbi:hypothetical protein, partial [Providencia sp. CRPN27545]
MPAFEWVHVQLHQQKGMISLSPPTICNSALIIVILLLMKIIIKPMIFIWSFSSTIIGDLFSN